MSAWSGWIMSLFSDAYRYEASRVFLNTVGSIDILVAASVLLPEIPVVAYFWIVFWGFATAVSRLYFLGRFAQPVSLNLALPLSEFLIRGANWICPLALTISHNRLPRLKILTAIRSDTHFRVATTMVAGALALRYLVDVNQYAYEFELEKKGMPGWFFHSHGTIALCAVVTWIFVWIAGRDLGWTKIPTRPRARLLKISSALTGISYGLVEGFDILIINLPHGIWFTGIRVIEHLTIYTVIILCLRAAFFQHSND